MNFFQLKGHLRFFSFVDASILRHPNISVETLVLKKMDNILIVCTGYQFYKDAKLNFFVLLLVFSNLNKLSIF